MKALKWLLSAIWLLMIPGSVLAQEDYVITVKGDTIKGKIIVQETGKVEGVQIKGDKKTYLLATGVRELYMKGDRYKPVFFSEKIQFTKIIMDGYLSLLGFRLQGQISYDGRLLQMRDGRLLEVPNINFKKSLANFLKDNEALASKVKSGDFGRAELTKIVDEYNANISKGTEVRQEQNKVAELDKTKIQWLGDFKKSIEESTLENKAEVLEMLADVESKTKAGQSLPTYLTKNLKEALAKDAALLSRFEDLLKKL